MVETDRCDGGAFGGRHIGCIQTPAQTDLKNEIIRRMLAKGEKSRRRGYFKKRDGAALIGRLDTPQHFFQKRFGNRLTAQNNTLVKAGEMRRVISVHTVALRLQYGAQHGGGRAFAIGAGNMNDGGAFILRMVERGQEPPHAVER